MNVTLFFTLTATAVALAGAACDVKTGHIPNGLTLSALGVGPVAHAAVAAARLGTLHATVVALSMSLGGAALCGALPFALFARGALGGGDVKLFAAIGAIIGPLAGLRAELLAFVLGGFYAVALAVRARRVSAVISQVGSLVAGSVCPSAPLASPELTPVRFGPVIFAGTLASIGLRWVAP
jgi:prepilin peptidase CpaA